MTQSSSTNQGERPQQRLVPVGPSHMHLEGWIFDVEMLMLAEYARILVAEVPVGWGEVKGSKLNAIWDSLGSVTVEWRYFYVTQAPIPSRADWSTTSRNPGIQDYPYGTGKLSEYTGRSLFTRNSCSSTTPPRRHAMISVACSSPKTQIRQLEDRSGRCGRYNSTYDAVLGLSCKGT